MFTILSLCRPAIHSFLQWLVERVYGLCPVLHLACGENLWIAIYDTYYAPNLGNARLGRLSKVGMTGGLFARNWLISIMARSSWESTPVGADDGAELHQFKGVRKHITIRNRMFVGNRHHRPRQ